VLFESAKTIVHAFITSRVDCCHMVLAESPKNITDRLQRVMNAAARVVTGTQKFDRGLTCLLHSELHWLDIPQRVQYKLEVMVHRYLHGMAPQYLIDCCIPTLHIASCQRLRSATRHQLIVPRHRCSRFGCLAFSVAGPMVWNMLPGHLYDPSLSIGAFRSALKTFLFTMHRDT